MFYMTTIHWIVVALFVLLFIILVILSFKEKNPKNRIIMIISSFFVVLLGAIIALFAAEKFTKKSKLLSYDNRRDLMSESIIFNGKLKNTGDYKLGYCKVEVKLTNNVYKMGRPKDSFFKPRGLDSIFGDKKEYKSNSVKEEFLVAKNIKPGEIKRFRVKMKYPPYFNNTSAKLTLNCH